MINVDITSMKRESFADISQAISYANALAPIPMTRWPVIRKQIESGQTAEFSSGFIDVLLFKD